MVTTITSDRLSISVKQHGAELCSLRGTSGHEYLWQADPQIWARHAPLLFPVVGALKENQYTCNGAPYNLPQHGFARDSDFVLFDREPTALRYRLCASPQSRAVYPFEFELDVTYRLEGSTLIVGWDVRNRGGEQMFFSIGAHPGFNLNWPECPEINDYRLEFEKTENVDMHLLGPDHLLSTARRPLLRATRETVLRADSFDDDAWILLDHRSRQVSLCTARSPRRLQIVFRDFPFLGIWSKPGAPFVCIEPWFGHVDPADHDGELSRKPGIITLEPHATFSTDYRIVVQEP